LLSHPAPARARFARAWLRKIGGRADAVAARALLDARPARAAALRAYLNTRPGGGIGPRLLDAAREGPRELRVRSIAAIGALAPPPARARLVGLLDDPAPEIRAATAAATADLQAALPGLLILQGDPAREVRAAAVRALAHQPGADAWAARLHALSDEAESVRVAAIRGLAGSAHPEAIARLEQRVHAGSARERFEAVSALARSPSTAAAVKVVEMVAHRDPDVRRAALAYVETL
jgi:HEAT repeat protein